MMVVRREKINEVKLSIPCGRCSVDYKEENIREVDLNGDGVYVSTCSKGHNSAHFISNDKYEMLFDLGILAIDNSFYREAVSSFAVSLERFYEYCVKVMLTSQGASMININKTWKSVSNMSERQVGAFYILYLSTFNDIPNVFNNNMTKFRNDVIHKGYFPTKEEVLNYAKEVYSYITRCLSLFKEHLQPSMDNYVLARKAELAKKYNDLSLSLSRIGTIIGMANTKTKFDFERSVHYLTGSYYPIYAK